MNNHFVWNTMNITFIFLGATVWHLDKLYLIGGYSIEYDCELKSFYQNPVTSVWIFDPSVGKWTMGSPLPKDSFGTNNKTIKFRGYCLGNNILLNF